MTPTVSIFMFRGTKYKAISVLVERGTGYENRVGIYHPDGTRYERQEPATTEQIIEWWKQDQETGA